MDHLKALESEIFETWLALQDDSLPADERARLQAKGERLTLEYQIAARNRVVAARDYLSEIVGHEPDTGDMGDTAPEAALDPTPGIATLGIVFLTLFLLKSGGVIEWSLWIVAAPLWLGLPILYVAVVISILAHGKT